MQNDAIARQRAELIIQVRSGSLTAKAAAQQLGVSRKTYYKWEQRALEGILGALQFLRQRGERGCFAVIFNVPVVNDDGPDAGVLDKLDLGPYRDIAFAEAERSAPCH